MELHSDGKKVAHAVLRVIHSAAKLLNHYFGKMQRFPYIFSVVVSSCLVRWFNIHCNVFNCGLINEKYQL